MKEAIKKLIKAQAAKTLEQLEDNGAKKLNKDTVRKNFTELIEEVEWCYAFDANPETQEEAAAGQAGTEPENTAEPAEAGEEE